MYTEYNIIEQPGLSIELDRMNHGGSTMTQAERTEAYDTKSGTD